VGFDVVELRPSKNRAPDFLAAKLVYKLLSLIFESVHRR
jgi:agmatinase